MIQITNTQAKYIRKNCKGVVIPTTNKFSSNKKKKQHYTEERNKIIDELLKRFSEEVEIVVETHGEVD